MTRLPHGFVVWLTGLPCSGKTTLANLLAEELRQRGVAVEVMDGDVMRASLSKDLGFSKKDRDVNVKRVGAVCNVLSRRGIVAVAAMISPYRETRDEIRTICRDRFVEVYVKCPVEVLIKRDGKGLYRKALAGEIQNFTGISDPYEEPVLPDIIVETDRESPTSSRDQIVTRLSELGHL